MKWTCFGSWKQDTFVMTCFSGAKHETRAGGKGMLLKQVPRCRFVALEAWSCYSQELLARGRLHFIAV